MTLPARFIFVLLGLGAVAAGFALPLLLPPTEPVDDASSLTAGAPDPVLTSRDLDLASGVVRRTATSVTVTATRYGTVRFLTGQWAGCNETDPTYVQYTVAGRLDQQALTQQRAAYLVGADLIHDGWSDGHNRGTAQRLSLLFTRDGVQLQLDQGATDLTMLYELIGPCLHGAAGSERLSGQPAVTVPQS